MASSIGPQEIMQMATGFWVSKTLFTGVELGVFDALASGAKSAKELAQQLTINEDSLERLLIALTALGLLQKGREQYANSDAAQEFLVRDRPNYLGGNFGHLNNDLYPLWRFLPDAIRENSPRWQQAFGPKSSQNPFEVMYKDPERLREFLAAMNTLSFQPVMELIESYDFSPHRCLLDIGGALGTLLAATLSNNAHLTGILLDLPPVVPLARDFINSFQLAERIKIVSGDMFTDALPVGADIITLGWILHDWDDERCVLILKKCFDVLPAGGTLLILEKLLDENKTGPVWSALMSLNMLVATVGGRERTAQEYGKLLAQAGFVDMQAYVLQGPRDYLRARKP